MPPEQMQAYLETLSFALLGIGALGLALRIYLGPRVLVAGWRGSVFKHVRALGLLLFGIGCAARTGVLPLPYEAASGCIGLGTFFFIFSALMIHRAVHLPPDETPGTSL